MVAHDGGGAHGIADEDGYEDHGDVHQHPVGRHPVLPGVPQELHVIQHTHHGHGDVGNELRGPVAAGLRHGPALKPGAAQTQETVIGSEKPKGGKEAAGGLADGGGPGCAGQAPAEDTHEQGVQDHVGHPGSQGEPEAQLGFFRRNEEALKGELEHEGGHGQQKDPSVNQAVIQQISLRSHEDRQRPQKKESGQGEDRPGDEGAVYEQRKETVRPLPVLLPQGLGHQGAAAHPQHGAHGPQDHQGGHDEVQRRKGRLAYVVGNEVPVHDAVHGGEEHGTDGREGEAQEFSAGEMIRELDTQIPVPPYSFLNSVRRSARKRRVSSR